MAGVVRLRAWGEFSKDIITYRNTGAAARLASRFYLAGSVTGVSGADGEWNSPRLSPRGRSRITEHGGDGSGFHPAMVRTCARAFASVIPGNRLRSSDSSRQLTLLAEDGADRVGIGLGDEEHPKSMVTRRSSDKRGVVSYLAKTSYQE